MIKLILIFLAVAVIASLFGYIGIAISAVSISQILFYVFLATFIFKLALNDVVKYKD